MLKRTRNGFRRVCAGDISRQRRVLVILLAFAGVRVLVLHKATTRPALPLTAHEDIAASSDLLLYTQTPSIGGVIPLDRNALEFTVPPDALEFASVNEAQPDAAGLLPPPHFLADDRIVAVTSVIVIESTPSAAAEAVAFLHGRYPFIHEVVLWNNRNHPMDHHLLPYDLAVRYVNAPYDYGKYARVLGCLLARHELCYFQADSLRPVYLNSLFATFLRAAEAEVFAARNGELVVASGVGSGQKYFEWDIGAFAHKGVLKRHMRNMRSLSALENAASRPASSSPESGGTPSFITGAAVVSDVLLCYGLRRSPIMIRVNDGSGLVHSTTVENTGWSWQDITDRTPSNQVVAIATELIASIAKDAASHLDFDSKAGTSLGRPSYELTSARREQRTPCADGVCTLVTNMVPATEGSPLRPATPESMPRKQKTLEALADMVKEHNEDLAIARVERAGLQDVHRGSLIIEAGPRARIGRFSQTNAADGDMDTAWMIPTLALGHQGTGNKPYLGIELLMPKAVTGVRLIVSASSHEAAASLSPSLEYAYPSHGASRHIPALGCTAEWTRLPPAGPPHPRHHQVLTFSCPSATVIGARLTFGGTTNGLDDHHPSVAIAEFQLTYVDCEMCGLGRKLPRRIAYVLSQQDIDLSSFDYHEVPGATMALIEEACEIAASDMTNVHVAIHVPVAHWDGSRQHKELLLRRFAAAASAASGSACNLGASGVDVLGFNARGGGDIFSSVTTAPQFAWDVVFVQIDALVSYDVLRRVRAAVGSKGGVERGTSTSLIARMTSDCVDVNVEIPAAALANGLAATADVLTVPSKRCWSQLVELQRARAGYHHHQHRQQQQQQQQEIRIRYPLRTLNATTRIRVPIPTNPPLEELVLLSTSATRPTDLVLFLQYAAPILEARGVYIRRVNISRIIGKQAESLVAGAHRTSNVEKLDTVMTKAKWTNLHDLARYVAIYPARAIWILDATANSGYYASVASVEAARFVVSPNGMPHHAVRMVAWNATCEWTSAGFAAKAHELVRGRFFWSSGVRDRAYLKEDAHDILVEEWPIIRKTDPLSYTIDEVWRWIGEVAAMKRHDTQVMYVNTSRA